MYCLFPFKEDIGLSQVYRHQRLCDLILHVLKRLYCRKTKAWGNLRLIVMKSSAICLFHFH